jgi:pimeloyl-ACP methyl ester carboxylesterase
VVDAMSDSAHATLARSSDLLARMLHDGITGSQLVIVAGGDHALIWARPDQLVSVVDEFLQA